MNEDPTTREIPRLDLPPADAVASEVVRRIRSVRPRRRTVLKGLLVAAAASVLTPIEWFYRAGEARAAGRTPTEHLTCSPETYDEIANNWWVDGQSTCMGGWRIGSFPCDEGFHREGSFSHEEETYISWLVDDTCGGRNAWRWAGVRCSDAWTTTVWRTGEKYEGLTIAACTV